MPTVPLISPVTGNRTPNYFIHTTDAQFVDNAGRTVLLRGVNLSGSSKAPDGRQSQRLNGFWQSGGETFVGRPLNLNDESADVHLSRLKGWGFNMLRYVVTWEALEHAGPGIYDYAFMDYTVRVLRRCKEHGFKVYMDPHQDVWSRFSGGSGAPYWTIPACGIDPTHFTDTQAAIVHCEYPNPAGANPASLPAMFWSTNYGRLAAQTLFTLFFAGRDFAPRCIIDGVNIQDYLQKHFIAAIGELADRIRDAGDLLDECVLGWDSLNEPHEGFCGHPDLNVYPLNQGSTLKKGSVPTPAQSFRLGMGQAQTVDSWTFGMFGPRRNGTVTIDPHGHGIWAQPGSEPNGVHPIWHWTRDPGWQLGTCVWALHGVWDVVTGSVIIHDYFRNRPSDHTHKVDFLEDYWKPHWQSFSERIRVSHPEAILFVAPPVFALPPSIPNQCLQGRCCYSAHYYDGLTLISQQWNWFNADALGLIRGNRNAVLAARLGERSIRKSIQGQLGALQADASILGAYPTIIGEIGIPYNMDNGRAYGNTDNGQYRGDYTSQQRALDASLNAADGPNALNYTIWTYCADNSHTWGDGWNLEDLSIWSADDLVNPFPLALLTNSPLRQTAQGMNVPFVDGWKNAYDFLTDGARAVKAFCRPYPRAIVGIPKDIQFDIATATFKLTVHVRAEDAPRPTALEQSKALLSDTKGLPTEIYVPLVHFASADVLEQLYGGQNNSPLALSVSASDGHWSVEGQLLRWWYPVPAHGEEDRVYTITISRTGGAIETAAERLRRSQRLSPTAYGLLLLLLFFLVFLFFGREDSVLYVLARGRS